MDRRNVCAPVHAITGGLPKPEWTNCDLGPDEFFQVRRPRAAHRGVGTDKFQEFSPSAWGFRGRINQHSRPATPGQTARVPAGPSPQPAASVALSLPAALAMITSQTSQEHRL